MRTPALAASLVGLGLVLAGCTATTSPKDTAPVVGPTVSEPTAAPSPSPTATPEPTEDPSTEPSIGPTEMPDETDEPQAPDGLDFLIPDDEVLFTADELYSSAVNDLYDDVEAADRSNRIGICRSAAIVVGGLTKSEIEERRDAMAPDDVEALEDFVSLCQRVLAS